jgi:hypothetical protein
MEMSFWTAVVIIVAITAFANIRIAKYRAQNGAYGPGGLANGTGYSALPGPREEELQREVQDLRERVKVLERIATDGRKTTQLADEIESLRDR